MKAHKTCRANLSEALEPLLSELQERWIRDFFMTPSAIHVNQLSSPALSSTSILLSVSTTSCDQPSPHGNVFVDLDASVLFAPAFAAGQKQLGVGIFHATRGDQDAREWFGKTFSQRVFGLNFRFVGTSSKSLMLLYDMPLEDSFLVSVTRCESSTWVRHYMYILKRKAMRKVCNSIDGAIDEKHILPCVELVTEQVHNRPCVLCGLPCEAECGCALISKRPSHPFDSIYLLNTLRPLMKSSEPADCVALKLSGKKGRIKLGGSKVQVREDYNPSMLQKLRTWSLSEYLRGLSALPWQPRLTQHRDDQAAASEMKICFEDHEDNDGYLLTSGMAGSSEGGVDGTTDLTSERRDACWETTCVPTQANSQNLIGINITPDASDGSALDGLFERAMSKVGSALLLGDKQVEACNVNTTADREERTTQDHPSCSIPFDRRSESLARLRYKQLQAHERREKNREAARRSNHKRKLELDALKANIGESRHQLIHLRKREAELRKENVELRARIESGGSTLVMFALPSADDTR